jgi:hypothetical protein
MMRMLKDRVMSVNAGLIDAVAVARASRPQGRRGRREREERWDGPGLGASQPPWGSYVFSH